MMQLRQVNYYTSQFFRWSTSVCFLQRTTCFNRRSLARQRCRNVHNGRNVSITSDHDEESSTWCELRAGERAGNVLMWWRCSERVRPEWGLPFNILIMSFSSEGEEMCEICRVWRLQLHMSVFRVNVCDI